MKNVKKTDDVFVIFVMVLVGIALLLAGAFMSACGGGGPDYVTKQGVAVYERCNKPGFETPDRSSIETAMRIIVELGPGYTPGSHADYISGVKGQVVVLYCHGDDVPDDTVSYYVFVTSQPQLWRTNLTQQVVQMVVDTTNPDNYLLRFYEYGALDIRNALRDKNL